MTYCEVRAIRWAHGYELYIDGVGVTQSYGRADAELMVRDYLAQEFGENAARDCDIRITYVKTLSSTFAELEDACAALRRPIRKRLVPVVARINDWLARRGRART